MGVKGLTTLKHEWLFIWHRYCSKKQIDSGLEWCLLLLTMIFLTLWSKFLLSTESAASCDSTTFWLLWWISMSTRVQMMLNHCQWVNFVMISRSFIKTRLPVVYLSTICFAGEQALVIGISLLCHFLAWVLTMPSTAAYELLKPLTSLLIHDKWLKMIKDKSLHSFFLIITIQ